MLLEAEPSLGVVPAAKYCGRAMIWQRGKRKGPGQTDGTRERKEMIWTPGKKKSWKENTDEGEERKEKEYEETLMDSRRRRRK